jgi:hypothetical protein
MASIVSPDDSKINLKTYSAVEVHHLFLPLTDPETKWNKTFIQEHNMQLETLTEDRISLINTDYARAITQTHLRPLLSKTGQRGAADPAICRWFGEVGIHLLRTAVAHYVADQMRLYAMRSEQPNDDLFDYVWLVGFEVPAQHIAIALQALYANPSVVIEDWSTCYCEVFDPRLMKPMTNLIKHVNGYHVFKNPRTFDHELSFPYDELIIYSATEVTERQIRRDLPEYASAFIFEHTRMTGREPFHVRVIPTCETGLTVPVDGVFRKMLSWESMLLEKTCSKWRSGHRMCCKLNNSEYRARGLQNYQHPIKWVSLPKGLLMRDLSEVASLALNFLMVRVDWEVEFDHSIGQALVGSERHCPLNPVNFLTLMTTAPTAPIVLVTRRLVGDKRTEVFFNTASGIDELKHGRVSAAPRPLLAYAHDFKQVTPPAQLPQAVHQHVTTNPQVRRTGAQFLNERVPQQPMLRTRSLAKPDLLRQASTAYSDFPIRQ